MKHTFLWHNELYPCSSQAFLRNHLEVQGAPHIISVFIGLRWKTHGLRFKLLFHSFEQLSWRCLDNPDSQKSPPALAYSVVQTLLSNYGPLCVFVNELTQYFMHILHILLESVCCVLWQRRGVFNGFFWVFYNLFFVRYRRV